MVEKKAQMIDDRFPQRKNPRLQNFDYSSPNYYFITICTHQKKCIFWTNGQLNWIGTIVRNGITQISNHFPDNRVDHYVIMPNHVHLILTVEENGKNISDVIGALKSYSSKEIHKKLPDLKVWQVSFHDHGIRNQKSYEKIWNYIENNPIRWKEDCFYEESVRI